ncbi:RNA-binding protein Lupus La [Artemisia annua]|uniref:RNA-binding protein Lupus La n=1 Tax=Artemisia annua TaxID=35608 RepID=A0A2U1QFK3_ARTAN|nr:RNA-binding protein Lupus La [Artemisia annua]
MGPSYVYVPTLPEAYRSSAHVLPHGTPGTMFMPRMDQPLHDPILKQIEYYFSDDNLVKDNFLRSHMDEEGWVPVTLIAGFRRQNLGYITLLAAKLSIRDLQILYYCGKLKSILVEITCLAMRLAVKSLVELLLVPQSRARYSSKK